MESHRRGQATGNMGLNQDEMYRPLRALDPNKFVPTCIPRKNHFVGMVSVSRTVDSRLCWGDDCPGQSRGRNAVAQTVVFHSFIPKPTAQRHCDIIVAWNVTIMTAQRKMGATVDVMEMAWEGQMVVVRPCTPIHLLGLKTH